MRLVKPMRHARTRTPSCTRIMTLGDFPFRTIEKLRFADTDCNGHVTNSVYAVLCQNARMELLCDPMRVPLPPTFQFAVVRFLLEFRAELHWPGTITVGTRLEQVGRSSVTLMQGIFADERCVAIANSVVALMDKATRRSVTMPDTIAHALSVCFSNGSPREMAQMNSQERTNE